MWILQWQCVRVQGVGGKCTEACVPTLHHLRACAGAGLAVSSSGGAQVDGTAVTLSAKKKLALLDGPNTLLTAKAEVDIDRDRAVSTRGGSGGRDHWGSGLPSGDC